MVGVGCIAGALGIAVLAIFVPCNYFSLQPRGVADRSGIAIDYGSFIEPVLAKKDAEAPPRTRRQYGIAITAGRTVTLRR